MLKHRALEQGQPVGRDMLDCFNEHRAVEIGERRRGFSHGAQSDLDLRFRISLQGFPPGPQTLQSSGANIQSDDPLDLRLFRQTDEEVSVAATKVENRARPGLDDNIKRLCKAPFM